MLHWSQPNQIAFVLISTQCGTYSATCHTGGISPLSAPFLFHSLTCAHTLTHTHTLEPLGAQPWSSYKEPHPPQVIQAPAIESLGSMSKPSFLPMAVPADLVERLTAFHGYPFLWVVGQFLQYLMRPSQQLGEYLEERRKFLNISHPIVGSAASHVL